MSMSHGEAATYIQEINATRNQVKTIYGKSPQDIEEENNRNLDNPDPLLFGGIDLAKRNDHSTLIQLALNPEYQRLEQSGHMKWPHVRYAKVAEDTRIINGKRPMELCGYDRTGVGDAAAELFDMSAIPLTPIVTTNKMKLDGIHIVATLLDKHMLLIDEDTEVAEQIEEQEEKVTAAGNTKYEHSGDHDDMFWAMVYACYVAVPYLLNNTPPVMVKDRYDERYYDQTRDINAELDQLMGGNATIF